MKWLLRLTCFLAPALLLVGVVLLWSASEQERNFEAILKAEPIHIAVDFSKPGRYEGVLKHTFHTRLGIELVLETTPAFTTEQEAMAAAAGLQVLLRIHKGDKEAFPETKIKKPYPTTIWWQQGPQPYRLRLGIYAHHFGELGDYDLSLEVTNAAPGLASRPQVLTANYFPIDTSEYEFTDIFVKRGLAILCFCFLFGLGAGAVLWRALVRWQRARGHKAA
ncbi:MAG: hypothetical protein ABSE73_07615 [Planctomycetota bacterium]